MNHPSWTAETCRKGAQHMGRPPLGVDGISPLRSNEPGQSLQGVDVEAGAEGHCNVDDAGRDATVAQGRSWPCNENDVVAPRCQFASVEE